MFWQKSDPFHPAMSLYATKGIPRAPKSMPSIKAAFFFYFNDVIIIPCYSLASLPSTKKSWNFPSPTATKQPGAPQTTKMIRIAAKLFINPPSYIIPEWRWRIELFFGRPYAKANHISLSHAPKNHVMYLKNTLKWPSNHQDMQESRVTLHKSAVSYRTKVTTIKYLDYRLEMSNQNLFLINLTDQRKNYDPWCRQLTPFIAHGGSRGFQLAYYSPNDIIGRHLIYSACIHAQSLSFSTATDGGSDCNENLTLNLHETYRCLPNDQELSKCCETFHQWTTLYHSWVAIMCNRGHLLPKVPR